MCPGSTGEFRIPPRQRILEAADDLFRRIGIRGVGVEAIAEAAGTNKMTLYRHFASKDELIAEWVRGIVEKKEAEWDDIALTHNVAKDNTVGFAILMLPDIFDNRAGAKRIDVRDNQVLDNNKPNTARPGSILATVPKGTGILYLGVDESEISGNVVRGHGFTGIAIADYCLAVMGGPFACDRDPVISLPFLLDQDARQNVVRGNTVRGNGFDPGAGNPFGFAASDLTLLTVPDPHGNCYAGNDYDTFFSLIGLAEPPECP